VPGRSGGAQACGSAASGDGAGGEVRVRGAALGRGVSGCAPLCPSRPPPLSPPLTTAPLTVTPAWPLPSSAPQLCSGRHLPCASIRSCSWRCTSSCSWRAFCTSICIRRASVMGMLCPGPCLKRKRGNKKIIKNVKGGSPFFSFSFPNFQKPCWLTYTSTCINRRQAQKAVWGHTLGRY